MKKTGKFYKIREKGYKFLTSISIPGIQRVFITEVYLFKVLLTILILTSISFGLFNISETVKDYYKFDVISHIESVTPKVVTFPAVTICTYNSYKRDRYKNFRLVDSEEIQRGALRTKEFIGSIYFKTNENQYNIDINQLDEFKIIDFDIDCVRFNGATNNKTLYTTNDSNIFYVEIKDFYIDRVSDREYFKYSLQYEIFAYIGDNYLDSYFQVNPLIFTRRNQQSIRIKRATVEEKLGEPYNQCLDERNYHQKNCIQACIYTEIKNNYNCTFTDIFAVTGLETCEVPGKLTTTIYRQYRDEFIDECEEECPVGCYSVKFSTDVTSKKFENDVVTPLAFSIIDFTSLKISQIPKMNGFSFVSNIGGSLGLFMGISFLNFVEIIELIGDLFLVAFIS